MERFLPSSRPSMLCAECFPRSFERFYHSPWLHCRAPARDDAWRQDDFPGARTVNQWREAYLRDWQERMAWLE